MRIKKYIVTRDVTPEECHWLNETITENTILYECIRCDYGCTNRKNGIHATLDSGGDYPGFEFPRSAITFFDEEENEVLPRRSQVS